MKENILLIKYQNTFEDNFTSYAYGKIIEKQTGMKVFYENCPNLREKFEKNMSDFSLKYNYISTNKVKEICKKAYLLNTKNIENIKNKSHYINISNFDLNNLNLLNHEIINDLKFNNTNFLLNYDLLEEINDTNSIGLFINKIDVDVEFIDYNYIYNATKRLNKYLKQPKLYVFTSKNTDLKLNSYIDFKIINIDNRKEEFYLFNKCKHKILINTPNSFSSSFWASVISQKEYNYVCFDKKLKFKNKPKNWIKI